MASPTVLQTPAALRPKTPRPAPLAVVQPAPESESAAAFETRFRAADLVETKRLAAIAGVCVVIVLVVFMGLIAALGANGRQQRGSSGAAPAVTPIVQVDH
jgi:hypothetical protein